MLPTAISSAGTATDNAALSRPRHRRSLAQTVGRAFAAFQGRTTVLNELNALSERELADIGLNRGDIHRVFDPAFAEEHARRG